MTRSLLLVEDDEGIRETLRMLLEDEGWRVFEAQNGVDALERLRDMDTLPSVILLDLMMPVCDGDQFLVEFRREPGNATIPILLLSAASTAELVEKERCCDVAAVVRKPFEVDDLLATVERVALR